MNAKGDAGMPHDIKVLQREDLVAEAGIVVGTRPGIIMLAPVVHEFRRLGLPHFVIHTGQHYSPNMDSQFFAELDLPAPDFRLEGVADKRTHGGQTASMLEGVEGVLLARRPCLLLVGGDANTNLAGALAARKLHISVGHVEAGERSGDWRMPEEHNRVVIDHIADHLFATDAKSVANLEREHVRGEVHLVGNPIVDASLRHLETAVRQSDALGQFALEPGRYALLTAHREENVDVAASLRGALEGVAAAASASGLTVLFLVHPRTRKRLAEFALGEWAGALPGFVTADAVGYLDFLALLANARLVFTDFGRRAAGGLHPQDSMRHLARQHRVDRDRGDRRQSVGQLRSGSHRRRRPCGAGGPALLGDAVRQRRCSPDRRGCRARHRGACRTVSLTESTVLLAAGCKAN